MGQLYALFLSSEHYRRSPLFQEGLEIQYIIKVSMPGTVKGHLLIDRYAEMIGSLYSKPTDDFVMGSYLEKSIQLQPQRKKQEKSPQGVETSVQCFQRLQIATTTRI